MRVCPCCSSDKNKLEYLKFSIRYVKCMNCSMVYIEDGLNDHILKEMYDDEGREYFLDKDKIQLDYEENRYDFELNVFNHLGLKKDAKILEIGYATGSFLNILRIKGYINIQGIDLSETSINYALRMGLQCQSGDFLNINFKNDDFDCIVMWATLEHLLYPKYFCNKAFLILKKGGYLILSVPNYNSLSQKILGKRFRYVGGGHLNYFYPETLEYMLIYLGFKVKSKMTSSVNPINIVNDLLGRVNMNDPSYKIRQQKRSAKIKGWIRNVKSLNNIYCRISKILNYYNLGDLLIVSAEK